MTDLLVPPHHPDALDLASGPTDHRTPPTGVLTLGLDLTGLGVAPAPWTSAADEPRHEIDQQRVAETVARAERAAVDFVAFDEDFALVPGAQRTTASRLDAARIACRLAPRTSRIGLVATLDTSYLDPVHVATAISTLHAKSGGRAAWQVGTSQVRMLGDTPEVWNRLAREIRTAVGSPATAPNPIEDCGPVTPGADLPASDGTSVAGRPAVVVRVASPHATAVAGAHADVVRIEAVDAEQARTLRADVRRAAAAAGRDPDSVQVLADAVVLVSGDPAAARARLDILADLASGQPPWRRTLSNLGGARQLADLLEAWFTDGIVDGFTLVPGSVPHDVRALVRDVLPLLRERGLARVPEHPPERGLEPAAAARQTTP